MSPPVHRSAGVLVTAALALSACGTARSETGPASLAAPASFMERPIGPSPRFAHGTRAVVGKAIVPYADSANLANSNEWGVPVVAADHDDQVRPIDLFHWGYGVQRDILFRIPSWARPSTGGDHHLAVVDGDTELDVWGAARQPDGSWRSGSRTIVRGGPIAGREAATASGFALTAGLVRPEEIAAGRIAHALTFTTPYTRDQVVPPAVKGDGRRHDARAMAMGSHVQLDPRAELSGLPRPQRIIARALQEYGAYLVDTGGSLAIRAESSLGRVPSGSGDIWGPVGVTDASLQAIPWKRLRVLAPR